MTQLEQQFDYAMMRIYERARDECQYTATRFLQMLHEKSGLATAQALLASSHASVRGHMPGQGQERRLRNERGGPYA